MRREEARAGSGELQLKKGSKEKKPVKGRLRRGQRHRRKMKVRETKREEGFEKEDILTSSKSAERCCRIYNWKLPVGFGTEKVPGAPVGISSGRSWHMGQVSRSRARAQVGRPKENGSSSGCSGGGEEGSGQGRGFVVF